MNSLISVRNLIRRDVCIGSNTGMYACAANNIWAAATSFIPSHTTNMNTTGNDIICDERRLGGIRGAKKKAGGSSTNGRNSAGRRLGIKVWPNKFAKAGNIIIRQRGNLFRAGTNVGVGKDHTLFAKADGMVSMTRLETNKKRNVVHVLPPQTPIQFNILAKLGIDPESLQGAVPIKIENPSTGMDTTNTAAVTTIVS